MSDPAPLQSAAVHPDTPTKKTLGAMYTVAIMLMAFLALQVWNMNSRVARIEVAQELQNENLRLDVRDLKEEIRSLTKEFHSFQNSHKGD